MMLRRVFGFSIGNVAKATAARTMSSTVNTDLVLTEEKGSNGLIIINRPKALNAGNYEMVDKVAKVLTEWRASKKLIVIKGAGGKAFCAGGDVRTLVEAPTPAVGQQFFRTEYGMNYSIGTLSIPYIALIDGITMGGGVGLSVHGKYRVATERTMFAMPETAIGLFPDVGGSHFLPRLKGQLGLYLGLTGFRLKGKDVLSAGIATHYCDSTKIEELEKTLLSLSNADKVDSVLNDFCIKQNDSKFVLADNLNQINKCFDAPTVEKILENLKNDGSEWAQKTIETLRTMSPRSLKVTHREILTGARLSLAECLKMEYRLAFRFMEDSDFHEGVAALLIRKDKKPIWKPQTIEEVTDECVQAYFKPLSEKDELKLPTSLSSKL